MGCSASGGAAEDVAAQPSTRAGSLAGVVKASPSPEGRSASPEMPTADPGQLPPYWTSTEGIQITPDPGRVAVMQELLTKTWRGVYTRDRKRMDSGQVPSGARVLNVLRVENHPSFRRYCEHISGVKARRRGHCARFPVCTDGCLPQLDSECNAMYLFHGTNPQAADAIARADFKLDHAGSTAGTMFGPGIYLAENSCKSDEYAKEGEGIFMGQCALLVCRAVAGQVMTVKTPGNYSSHVLDGQCDSICGDRLAAVGTYREMVFFHEAAVYPEFIVLYCRVFDESAGAGLPAVEPSADAARSAASATPSTVSTAPTSVATTATHVKSATVQAWEDCMGGNYRSVRSLLDKGGVDVNHLQHGGKSMMDIVSFRGDVAMMKFLYDKGAHLKDGQIDIVRDGIAKGRCKQENGDAAMALIRSWQGQVADVLATSSPTQAVVCHGDAQQHGGGGDGRCYKIRRVGLGTRHDAAQFHVHGPWDCFVLEIDGLFLHSSCCKAEAENAVLLYNEVSGPIPTFTVETKERRKGEWWFFWRLDEGGTISLYQHSGLVIGYRDDTSGTLVLVSRDSPRQVVVDDETKLSGRLVLVAGAADREIVVEQPAEVLFDFRKGSSSSVRCPHTGLLASMQNGATCTQEGVCLDGKSKYVTFPSYTFGGPTSIEALVRFDSVRDWMHVVDFNFSYDQERPRQHELWLGCVDGGSSARWAVQQGTRDMNAQTVKDTWIPGQWVHVVVTVGQDGSRDGLQATKRFYRNGELTSTHFGGAEPEIQKRSNHLIGARCWSGQIAGHLHGTIAYVRFWHGRVLSLDKVQELYAVAAPFGV